MLDTQLTVAEIVLRHPETARVLRAHHIDFCCKGGIPLTEALREGALDEPGVIAELDSAIAERSLQAGARRDFASLSTPALIAHIVDRHHGFLRQTLPFIGPLAEKVARVHGDRDPRLVELHARVEHLIADLGPHLEHEERVLFPAMMAGRTDGPVQEALASMYAEHLVVGRLLEEIRFLCDDHQAPEWACGSYRTLLAELRALEEDILAHVHLENHVLMTRAAA